MLNQTVLSKLFLFYKDDAEVLQMIEESMGVFSDYHKAVFSLEMYKKIHEGAAAQTPQYKETVMSMDRTRTVYHNSLLSNVSMLNNMAKVAGLPPVYDGIVSQERPYRRQVANAVFAFMEDIINNRS